MLFDPFEKDLNPPPVPIKLCNRMGRQHELIRKEDKGSAFFSIEEFHPAKLFWVILLAVETCKDDCLIASDTGFTGRDKLSQKWSFKSEPLGNGPGGIEQTFRFGSRGVATPVVFSLREK